MNGCVGVDMDNEEPDDARKYAENTRGRPFDAGNPGKPKGARHKITRAVEELLEGEHEALTRKAIERALDGDMTALRLCLDRIAPARKDSPVSMEMPPVTNAEDTAKASAAVLAAVSDGTVTPDEGARLMGLLVSHKTILETGELERRVTELEAKNGKA